MTNIVDLLLAPFGRLTRAMRADAACEIEALRAELYEQVRLLGMGGEREAKLASDNVALRAENARLYEWKDKAGDMDRVKTVELVDLRAENAKLLRRIHLFKNTRNEQVFEKLMKAHEENAKLREALKPFSDRATATEAQYKDCYPPISSMVGIEFKYLRAARKAMGESDE